MSTTLIAKPFLGWQDFAEMFNCGRSKALLLMHEVGVIHIGHAVFVRAEDEALPNALFEFGEPLPCTEELYAHIGEHGDVVARRDAVATLQRYFC